MARSREAAKDAKSDLRDTLPAEIAGHDGDEITSIPAES
jgi:hypothetical protein